MYQRIVAEAVFWHVYVNVIFVHVSVIVFYMPRSSKFIVYLQQESFLLTTKY